MEVEEKEELCPWCGEKWWLAYWNPLCPKCQEHYEQTKIHVIGITKEYYRERQKRIAEVYQGENK